MKRTNTGKWFILSIISLGLGGSFAFLIGMSRAPGISAFFPEDYFRRALVGHVDLAILCWLLISAIVLWNHFLESPQYKNCFRIGALGVTLIFLSALPGSGEAVLNNYVPAITSPFFFTGITLFFLAFCLSVFDFLGEGILGLSSENQRKNILSVSLIIALIMIVAVLASLLLLGGDKLDDQHFYFERLFWTPGHIQQILNASLLVIVWYALLRETIGKEPEFWGFLEYANRILIISALLLLAMLFFFDPLDRVFKIGAEIIYGLGIGVPLFLHIANILRQYKFVARQPASSALLISIIIYLYGIFIAYGGFGNDTRVPAHYHGAVTALTLALMGFAFHMISGFKIKIAYEKLARSQPYIYGLGMVLFISGLFVSGLFGAPRKTPGTDWTDNPVVLTALSFMGIGTLLAVIGGASFVVYAGVTVYREEKQDE